MNERTDNMPDNNTSDYSVDAYLKQEKSFEQQRREKIREEIAERNNTSFNTSGQSPTKTEKAAEAAQVKEPDKKKYFQSNDGSWQEVKTTGKDKLETNIDPGKQQFLKKPEKYDNVHKLDATQNRPNSMHYVNFKQDYIVIIRKKPFYASTSQQRQVEIKEESVGTDGKKEEKKYYEPAKVNGKPIEAEMNFLRVYQVNNYTNARTSISVYGKSPGSCSVTIRGGERVVCAENEDVMGNGWLSWDEFINGWLSINEAGVIGDHSGLDLSNVNDLGTQTFTDNLGTVFNSPVSNDVVNYVPGLTERAQQLKMKYGLTDAEAARIAALTNGQSWKKAEASWASVKDGSLENGITFRSLNKTREAKYGWRFAEKCDWEPMDEIMIYGKSRVCRNNDPELNSDARDSNGILLGYHHDKTSEFRIKRIFFGYIDSVVKTYTAAKGGCLISIQARDHLKLLELSRSTSTPSFIPGKASQNGLEINWNTDKYGWYQVNFPVANGNAKESSNQDSYILDNILAGLYPDESIWLLAKRAGIPEHYLTKRIEPIRAVPFLGKSVGKNFATMGNSEMKSRLAECNSVAEKLLLEFFADEEGNLVLKIPNYVLGVNMLRENNGGIKYPDFITLEQQVNPKWKITTDENGNPVVEIEQTGSSNASKMNLTNMIKGILERAGLGKIKTIITDKSIGENGILTATGVDSKIYTKKQKGKKAGSQGEKDDSDSKSDSTEEVSGNAVEDIIDLLNEQVELIDRYHIYVTIGTRKNNDEICSLYDAASHFYGNKYKWKRIAKLNNIKDPTRVLPGDKIIVDFDNPIIETQVYAHSDISEILMEEKKRNEIYNNYKNIIEQATGEDFQSLIPDGMSEIDVLENIDKSTIDELSSLINTNISNNKIEETKNIITAASRNISIPNNKNVSSFMSLRTFMPVNTPISYSGGYFPMSPPASNDISTKVPISNGNSYISIDKQTINRNIENSNALTAARHAAAKAKLENQQKRDIQLKSETNHAQENHDNAVKTEKAVQGTGINPEKVIMTKTGEITPATQIVPDDTPKTFGAGKKIDFKNPLSGVPEGTTYTLKTSEAYNVSGERTVNGISAEQFSGDKAFTSQSVASNVKGTTTEEMQKQAIQDKLNNLAAQQNAFNKAKFTHISAYTDADIINITPEYIISFTLQDTDKELYNMYQVGGDAYLGILDPNGSNNVQAIVGAVPDMTSILQFGMRPHPGTIQSPLVQNQAEASLLGMMLVLQSQANRLTGTLTAIDEPTIRVGDPIRIHMYDEHPHKPIMVTVTEEDVEKAKNNTTEEGEEKRTTKKKTSKELFTQPVFDPLIFPEQAVFYVTNVERSIDPSGTSTMTLQLKAGRVMGAWSVYEAFRRYYENYYWWDVQHRDDYLDGNNPIGDEKTDKKSPYWQWDHSIKDNEAYKKSLNSNGEDKSSQSDSNTSAPAENPSAGGATDAGNTPAEADTKSSSTEESGQCNNNSDCGDGCDCSNGCDCNNDCDNGCEPQNSLEKLQCHWQTGEEVEIKDIYSTPYPLP